MTTPLSEIRARDASLPTRFTTLDGAGNLHREVLPLTECESDRRALLAMLDAVHDALKRIDEMDARTAYERDIDCDWKRDCEAKKRCLGVERMGGTAICKVAREALKEAKNG